MAKFDSITIGKGTGSLGNVTLRRVKGENIASQKVSKGTQKVGTYAQVLRRVRWSNLVTAYQMLNALGDGHGMSQAFPQRPVNQNNFNAFMKANLGVTDVASVVLPKDKADSRFLVPAPFIVSQGTLTAPEALMATFANGAFTMAGTNNFANVGELCAALIASYGFENGDVATFIVQQWNEGGAKFTSEQIVINSASTEALPSWITSAGVITAGNAIANSEGIIIRGRNSENGYLVSPAQFGDGMTSSTPYTLYTGSTAMEDAVESYGYRTDPYLQANPQ